MDELLDLSLKPTRNGATINQLQWIGAPELQYLDATNRVAGYAHLGELTARDEVEVRPVSRFVEVVHWRLEHRLFLGFPISR